MTGQERAAAIQLLGQMLERNLGNRLTPEVANGMLEAMEKQMVPDSQPKGDAPCAPTPASP
jgi:hypothetical protein